jgi:hypothetical protein
MSKIKVSNEEVMRILSLHENYKKSLVVEQTKPTTRNRTELIQFFAKAKANLCLTDPNLKYDAPFRTTGESRGYIKGPSNRYPGMDKRIYDDFSVEVIDPSSLAVIVKTTWACDALKPVEPEKEEQKNEDPNKPKPLNKNQNDVLAIIKKQNFFHEPAPSDVQIKLGNFDAVDLTNKKNVAGFADEDKLIEKYSEYFPEADFPQGFFVYKKRTTTPSNMRRERVQVTGESCRIAIENLWNNVNNPKSFGGDDYTPEQIENDKFTATKCAEPVNASKFLLRQGLKNKLIDLSKSKYRINIGNLR